MKSTTILSAYGKAYEPASRNWVKHRRKRGRIYAREGVYVRQRDRFRAELERRLARADYLEHMRVKPSIEQPLFVTGKPRHLLERTLEEMDW